MNLSELRQELKDKSKTPLGERFYPITSEWIPIPDALALVDRFEKDLANIRNKIIAKKKLTKEALNELTEVLDSIMGRK